MSDRVNDLISSFEALYSSNDAPKELLSSSTKIHPAVLSSMITDGSFISSNLTERDFFDNRPMSDLIEASTKLYDLYTSTSNNYHKIVASLLLYRIFSYYLPNQKSLINLGCLPYEAISMIDDQEFEQALTLFRNEIINPDKASEPILKGIGIAFYERAFQLLENQVQDCIRNRKPHLFYKFDNQSYALRVGKEREWMREVVKIPVRIELTSCVGSDIFLLSMLRPEKARCINISVDLYDHALGRFQSPIQVITRPIKEYGIRLTSQDLGISKLITSLDDLFNMRNDDVSLLKAAVIASGIIPPSLKDSTEVNLKDILVLLLQDLENYNGFELITIVQQIPRGSGLAVSTNLLSGMIFSLLRFSGQCTGSITDAQKVDVATRAIYGEWLGGSGGGSQDYGGMWGGFKEILGVSGDSQYEPNSAGGFLPAYQEMILSEESTTRILDSLVLVNGGTGQNVGPILKMITSQFTTKNAQASYSRTKTEMNYKQIRKALLEGNANLLASIEDDDFNNRVNISPLANNKYHEVVYQQLQSELGDSLWGYDSTGGRAGAGGVFWVSPDKKDQLKKSFLEISRNAQEELTGQMHFASPPIVYEYSLNREGIRVEHISEENIQNYFTTPALPVERKTEQADVDEIKSTYGFNASFRKIQKAYQDGELSLSKNINTEIDDTHIVLPESALQQIPSPGSVEHEQLFKYGLNLLREQPIAYITLNGGESTRYGTSVIRSLNPSIFVDRNYCSPIELKLAHFRYLRNNFDVSVLPIFVNGYFTEKNTKRVLNLNNYYGINKSDIYHCSHEVIHRVVPTIGDLSFWFNNIREKSRSNKEEELVHQYHYSMIDWIKEQGEGNVYSAVGKNKLNTLVSPGHFFSFMSIVTQGILGNLVKRGVQHLVVSSNDNLMSTIDPAIFAYHVVNHNRVTSEVVPKLFDRGGAPIMVNGRIEIYEDFRFPDMETLSRVPYFNPITSWIKIETILDALSLNKIDVINASEGNKEALKKCAMAVRKLGDTLQTYPVLKHINEDMGKGIVYAFPVIQFEKLFGDLISTLSPEFLLVPKLMRHTQIKSIDHIYQLYNDRSLDILKTQIALNPQSVKEREPWTELTT